MRISRLDNPRQLQRLFAFRHHIYVEELAWLPRPDGHRDNARRVRRAASLLVDEFDTVACNYAAFDDDGSVVGSVRVVPDTPLGLPLERCSSLGNYRQGRQLVEVCRLAVDPKWRSLNLAGLLMKAAYQCAKSMGASHIVLDTYIDRRRRTYRLYSRMGFEALGEPHPDPNYLWRLPVLALGLDIVAAERDWPTARPGLFRFFTTSDPGIDHGAAQVAQPTGGIA